MQFRSLIKIEGKVHACLCANVHVLKMTSKHSSSELPDDTSI